MKIDTLTTEQTAKLSEYREKWLKIGLSCAPLDFEAAKDAAIRAYAVAGLAPPTRFYHMSSPVGAAILAAVLQLKNQVWAQVRDQVRAQVYGSHDAHWLGFYDFFATECHIADAERLRPLMDLAQACGWWAPYQDAVIFQDRHSILRRDDQHRLHCETGPAVAYPDGYRLFFWHGTAVPGHWITHKSDLLPEAVLRTANVEQRRAGCEILGWERILNELRAVEIDANPNPQIGTLLEVDLPDAGKEKFLRVNLAAEIYKQVITEEHLENHTKWLDVKPSPGWRPMAIYAFNAADVFIVELKRMEGK